MTNSEHTSFLSLSSYGLLDCFVEGSGLLGCCMMVAPGSLEGASPSPWCPEAWGGLCPVKAVVWILAAALRDLWVDEGQGKTGKSAQGRIKNPLHPQPAIYFPICTTLFGGGGNKTKQKNQTMDTWLKSLLKMQMQSFLLLLLSFQLFPIQSQITPL